MGDRPERTESTTDMRVVVAMDDAAFYVSRADGITTISAISGDSLTQLELDDDQRLALIVALKEA